MEQKTLRIAFVVGTFPTVSETFIVNQMNALVQLGHEVQLFSFKQGNTSVLHSSILQNSWHQKVNYPKAMPAPYLERIMVMIKLLFSSQGGINFKELRHALNPFKWKKEALGLRWFYKAQWFILNSDFDVVHVHFGPNAEKIGQLKSSGFLGKARLVATFHGYDLVADRVNDYLTEYQHIWKYFDWLTVNTPYLEGILRQLPFSIPTISILPMGLDTVYFKTSISEKHFSSFKILFVGRLIPLKGVDLGLQAIAKLKERGHKIDFTIIGAGPQKEKLLALCYDLGILENVHFLGAKTQEDVKGIMDQSHVLLMPGRSDPLTGREETQGLVIQEAQAMGLPVVVSSAGGMSYGMVDQETGLIFSSENLEGLVESLERIIENSALYLRLSTNARNFVVKNYDYRILGRELHRIYLRLLT